MTDAEFDCIINQRAPSPFADAVAAVFLRGVGVYDVAKLFKIETREASLLIRWVCETNLRQPPRQPTVTP